MPAPPVPAECDLRDFTFMPLDCVRLRDSDLAAKSTGDEFRAAVLLWCASWHQVPAASLPDDDDVLARLAGYGRVLKEWLRVKVGALRGWVKCDDGRLYHPVVAEKALEAWRGKLQQRWRSECARIKKHCQRHSIEFTHPEFDEWLSLGCPQGQALPVPEDKPPSPQDKGGDNASKGKGQGERQGQGQSVKTSEANASGASAPLEPVDKIFAIGVPLLTTANVSERNARSMLGAFRKTYTDEAICAVLDRCAVVKPLQPVAWLQEALKVEIASPTKRSSGPPWWFSDASIIAKGNELGLSAKPGESMNEFKGRIQVRLDERATA